MKKAIILSLVLSSVYLGVNTNVIASENNCSSNKNLINDTVRVAKNAADDVADGTEDVIKGTGKAIDGTGRAVGDAVTDIGEATHDAFTPNKK